MRTRRIAGTVAAGVAAVLLTGCAIGQAPDGSGVVGMKFADSGQIQTPTDQLQDAAGFLPAPWDKLAVAAIGLAGGGMYGRERGRHTGWEERESAAFAQAPLGGAGVQPETGSSLSSRAGV